ncbi:DUF2854 domain-containing protein [Gloeomargarita lithophora]|uniref:DUF2854 domain-containing protein n=1 Tax=Gloeomargarita lithophora TaxID=1188228 RepID=UPI0008F96F21
MLQQIPLGGIGLVVGSILTVIGLGAYFADMPTLNLAGFFYGIPLLLGGLALKAAELPPVPWTQPTPPEVIALRTQATPTQKQIRQEVTRYRYGEKVHLGAALERLKLGNTDQEWPVLAGIHEEVRDHHYTLVLTFDSPDVAFTTWQEKAEKLTNFFGPDIKVALHQTQDEWIELALLSTRSLA